MEPVLDIDGSCCTNSFPGTQKFGHVWAMIGFLRVSKSKDPTTARRHLRASTIAASGRSLESLLIQ